MKKFKFEIKEMQEDGTFTGIASMYGNLDLGGDIVEKGAFTKTMREKMSVPILWQHNTHSPIGVGELEDTETGLMIKGTLNLDVGLARECYSLIKQGAIKGLSIGYDVVKQDYINGIRFLKELKLWEVSIVTFPMNTQSTIVDVKAGRKISKTSKGAIESCIALLTSLIEEEAVDDTSEPMEDDEYKACGSEPKKPKKEDDTPITTKSEAEMGEEVLVEALKGLHNFIKK